MPLYARTEKRLKRKEREDELGITAVKQAMKESGELDDSGSGSDGSVSGESSDEDEDEDEDEAEEEASDAEDSEEGEGSEKDDDDIEEASEADSEAFPLTIEEVETNPIYPLEEYEGCLLCPGKLLKHGQMRDTHLSSASHNRAMKRWKARLAEANTRPLPETNDPRDVMNEILDDLEDRRTGAKPVEEVGDDEATNTPAAAATEPKATTTTKTEGDGGRKDKRASRRKDRRARSAAERRNLKAQEAVKSVESTNRSTPKTKATEGDEAEGGKAKGLNRRARRLLAKQSGAVGNGEGKKANSVKTKEGKGDKGKDLKESKAAGAPATETGPVESEGKEKKRRKRNPQSKASA